ncbi:type I-E CRISPR-associated protein Cse2/CasB [Streptomyces sp. NPDC020607]|uniref:type I-E CRISPR-associated protein Cse2/CasB n=1 Tax=Streptomyces sp. NPDC020607 TaxID=3365082 RepID=UPI0037B1FCEE
MTAQSITEGKAAARRRHRQAFTVHVEKLCLDAGARTALRSGLGRGMDDVRRMHRFIAPWLPGDRVGETEQRAYYGVAAMIASQPRQSPAERAAPAEPEPSAGREPEPSADQEPGRSDTPGAATTASARYGTSLGTAFALAVTQGPGRDRKMRESSAESRLNLLTRQSITGLHRHLPASVRYLRSLGVPLDWAQLLDDLIAWPEYSGRIARRWLQDYYRLSSRALSEHADLADRQEAEAAAPGA